MTAILGILDDASARDHVPWYLRLRDSLTSHDEEWLNAVRETGTLSDDRAWALLAWMEIAASNLVRERSEALLQTASFARTLLTFSVLDERDIAIVESLLRRGAELAELNFSEAVAAGCARAGQPGEIARASLLQANPTTPTTHSEVGAGADFSFDRSPADFDVNELERWLAGNDK